MGDGIRCHGLHLSHPRTAPRPFRLDLARLVILSEWRCKPREAARRWLADQGVSQVRDGWVSDEKPDALLTARVGGALLGR